MNNITRTTLAAAAMLTLLASSASAAVFCKLGDVKGESEYQLMLEFEEARFLDESESARGEHEITYDIAAFTDPATTTAEHEEEIDIHGVMWYYGSSEEPQAARHSRLNFPKVSH